MQLAALDWLAIVATSRPTSRSGLYYRRRATGSTEDYFVSGRNVSWWLAGTSMVATTFAGTRRSRSPARGELRHREQLAVVEHADEPAC